MAQRYTVSILDHARLLTALEANAADLPQLEIARDNLKELLAQIQGLVSQQDLHRATKQQVNKTLHELLAVAQQLAAFIRAGLKHHYGKDSEKLVEFGVQPFRGLRRAVQEEPAPEPEPEPELKAKAQEN